MKGLMNNRNDFTLEVQRAFEQLEKEYLKMMKGSKERVVSNVDVSVLPARKLNSYYDSIQNCIGADNVRKFTVYTNIVSDCNLEDTYRKELNYNSLSVYDYVSPVSLYSGREDSYNTLCSELANSGYIIDRVAIDNCNTGNPLGLIGIYKLCENVLKSRSIVDWVRVYNIVGDLLDTDFQPIELRMADKCPVCGNRLISTGQCRKVLCEYNVRS